MTLDIKYKAVLLEAIADKRYRLALELSKMKGGPMDKQRRLLTQKQNLLEALEHEIEAAAQ